MYGRNEYHCLVNDPVFWGEKGEDGMHLSGVAVIHVLIFTSEMAFALGAAR